MPEIEKHLNKVKNKTEIKFQIKEIDFIYLINLDNRPQKLERSLKQFNRYGITPHRFPAIYGWTLSQEVFDEIGMKFLPPMDFAFDGHVFYKMASDIQDKGEKLNASSYGKTIVHQSTSAGSLGGSLSHLSVLQDAYDSGYQTVWVLEDDFTLRDDPRHLSSYIEKLDKLTGNDWDVLYTDDDHHFHPYGTQKVYLRPDRPIFDHTYEHTPVGSDFYKIGGRWQLHSRLVRRSGIEKILNHIKKYGFFRTLDVEINFVPGLKMYNLKSGLVHGRDRTDSDTQIKYF